MTKKQWIVVVLLLCQSFAPAAFQEAISYEGTIRPIIENYCTTCHAGQVSAAALDLTTYESVRYQAEHGPLLQRINDAQDPMPMGGLMPQQERLAIARWANSGFLRAGQDTAKRLEPQEEARVAAAAIKPIDISQEGAVFFELMQGHWVGNMNSMGQQYDWFTFDYRPIAPSHIYGIYEGGSMGNLFTSFFWTNFKGTPTIMARNGGVLNGIYRTSYFVLDKVVLGPQRNYFRLVDAIGGANIMYMELEFSKERLLFKSYTSRFGANGKPRLHMRFDARRTWPAIAEQAAKVLDYPQAIVDKDFSQGLPTPKWDPAQGVITSASYLHTAPEKDLTELGQLAGDPYTRDELPYLTDLTVVLEQNKALQDHPVILYLSQLPLTDKEGKPLMEYGSIKEAHWNSIFHFPELVPNATQFSFHYLHPGDYYLTVVGDVNGDHYLSSGDLTSVSQRITILPEEEIVLESSTEETFFQKALQFFLKELQTAIAIFYGSLVAVGMLFTYHKYAAFGINIFEYADVFDFLVAPFADLSILVFAVVSCLIVGGFFRWDNWMHKKFPVFYSKMNFGWDKKANFDTYRKISFVVLTFMYLGISSGIYGLYNRKVIKKRTPILLKYSDNHTIRGIYIGKTKEVLFLLHRDKVKAIPINSAVKEFEIQ